MDLFTNNLDINIHINSFTLVNMDSTLKIDPSDLLKTPSMSGFELNSPQMQGSPAPSGPPGGGGGGENIAAVGNNNGSPNED